MNEIMLHILDIVQNSFRANSKNVRIIIHENEVNIMHIIIEDDGIGMTSDEIKKVIDPFYTSRTTRKVGMGIPLFKEICELSGGSFCIDSEQGKGTRISARIDMNSIDSLPLGNVEDTIYLLMINNDDCEIYFEHNKNNQSYNLETIKIKEMLEGIPLTNYEVMKWIKKYIFDNENMLK